MSIYFGIDSDYAGTLFSSLGSGSSNSGSANGLSSLLSEYSSIQSGSYRKLLNSYYGDSGNDHVSSIVKKSIEKSSISTAKDETKKLTSMKDAADSLSDAAKELTKTGSKSVFAKEYKTDSEGNVNGTYNTDKIYNSVKDFVDKYNSLISATDDSNTGSINTNMKSIISNTKINGDMLEDLGITINSDYTLSIDEEKFKNADMSIAKSLFSGTGSYAYQVGVKASMVSMNASTEAAKSNTYNSYGNYSYNFNSGDLYNTIF